jgi:HK97 family phage major capsid protein
MTILELRNQRGKFIADARKLVDRIDEEKRDFTSEEDEKYKILLNEAQKVKDEIDRRETLEKIEKDLDQPVETKSKIELEDDASALQEGLYNAPEYRQAAQMWMRDGITDLEEKHKSAIRKQYKALQVDINTAGGYLVAPTQMVQGLLKAIDNMTFIRQLATKYQVASADSLGVVSLESDPDDADWTSELKVGTEDTGMAFGGRELHPHPLGKYILISNTLLRRAIMNVEDLVNGRLMYKFSITEEKHHLTGTGAQQPLGLFTASALGIPTSRDVSSGNTTTSIQFDGLISAKYALKGAYWPRSAWIFHRDAMTQIAKLKDGNGQYVWRENVRGGEPDTLLARPFYMSEYAPNTFSTGKYVGIFGDYTYYWIADALDMMLQRLVELKALTNQTVIIGRRETDGMPVLAEAFVRVKLA